MQGGDGGVHGAGELGLIANIKLGLIANMVRVSLVWLQTYSPEVDGVLIDTREDSPGSLILEIWDKGYQQVDILVPFLKW